MNLRPEEISSVIKEQIMKYKTELEEGIKLSYEDFLNNPMRAER